MCAKLSETKPDCFIQEQQLLCSLTLFWHLEYSTGQASTYTGATRAAEGSQISMGALYSLLDSQDGCVLREPRLKTWSMTSNEGDYGRDRADALLPLPMPA